MGIHRFLTLKLDLDGSITDSWSCSFSFLPVAKLANAILNHLNHNHNAYVHDGNYLIT